MDKKLLEYNQLIFNRMYHTYDTQKYFQLGFFNGNQLLFLGINPGMPYTKKLREEVNIVIEHTNFDDFQKDYEKVIRITKMGSFIKMIVGDDWSKIGLTNIVKIATISNQSPTNELIDNFLPITKRQIELLQPKIVLCMGKFVGSFFKLFSFYSFKKINNIYYLLVPHPSYLFRKGLINQTTQHIKLLIKQLLKKCDKDFLAPTQLTLSI